MPQLPKRMKEITSDNLPYLKKSKDWFIIFWLAYTALNFFDPSRTSLGGGATILLPMFKFILLIGSAISLSKIVNRLYRYPLLSIIYILTLVIPYFIIVIAVRFLFILATIPFISSVPCLDLIRFLILSLVVRDSNNIFEYFKKQGGCSADETAKRMNRDIKNLFIGEGLVLAGFIISIIFIMFALPEMSPGLTDGFGGLIYGQVIFIYISNFYPFYFLIKGLVIGGKSIVRANAIR